MTTLHWIALIHFLSILVLSALLYKHRKQEYSLNKLDKISSPHSFGWVYRFIQISLLLAFYLAHILRWPKPHPGFDQPWVTLFGLIISTAGFLLFVAAKKTLGRNYSPCSLKRASNSSILKFFQKR